MPPLTRSSANEIPALHGLRALAIAMILIFHFWLAFRDLMPPLSAFVGNFLWHFSISVTLFFVMSAQLISASLLREYERNGRISIPRFMLSRALRIFPAYYFFVLLALGLLMLQRSRIMQAGGADPISGWYFDFFYVSNYFRGIQAHTWTLSIEEQFYLVFPFLTLFLFRLKRSTLTVVLTLLYLIPLVCRAWMLYNTPREYFNEHVDLFLHTRFDDLVAGLFITLVIKQPEARKTRAIIAVVSFALILAPMILVDQEQPLWYLVIRPNMINIGFAGFVLLALGLKSFEVGRIVTALARLSYSIYLWHMVAGIFAAGIILRGIKPGEHLSWLTTFKAFALSLFITVLFGLFSYYAIERPFLKLKERLARPR
ncbi:MAG: acyltransferase [Spirochaetia bacterium]|nr:acyltransferase [Spirochaetia bacterium]